MSTQLMQKTIADYFKTQPVLKAWLLVAARKTNIETAIRKKKDGMDIRQISPASVM